MAAFRPAGRLAFFSRTDGRPAKSKQKRLPRHPAPAAPGFVHSLGSPEHQPAELNGARGLPIACARSRNFPLRILPVAVAGNASTSTIWHGRL